MNNMRFDNCVTHIKSNAITRVWIEPREPEDLLCWGESYPPCGEDATWIPVGTYASHNFHAEYLREDIRFAYTHPEPLVSA